MAASRDQQAATPPLAHRKRRRKGLLALAFARDGHGHDSGPAAGEDARPPSARPAAITRGDEEEEEEEETSSSATSTAPSTPTTPLTTRGGSSAGAADPDADDDAAIDPLLPLLRHQASSIPSLEKEGPLPPVPTPPPLATPAPAAAPYLTIDPPSPPPPGLLGKLQTAWAVCFLGLMGASLYIVLATAAYIAVGLLLLGHRTLPFTLMALWVAQALAPIKQFQQDPKAMRRSWLFREMARYFGMRVVKESKLDPTRHYLFAQFPHGTIPLAAVLSAHYIDVLVPGKRIFCLIHTGIMHLPIVRFFMGHWGALTADKENVALARRRGKGDCSIIVGGVAEIFLQNEETETVRLRKGFIREALRNGYDLVPMFHFGNTRMYKFIGPPAFWRRLSSYLPFPFFLVEGRGRISLIPKKVPLLLAVGSPLGAQALCGLKDQRPLHDQDPDPEMVDRVYAAFKAQLRTLYYTYRPEWETRELVVVDG